jgi:hypothetical protein
LGGGREYLATTELVQQLTEHKTLGSALREELEWLASHGTVRYLNTGDVLSAKGATRLLGDS